MGTGAGPGAGVGAGAGLLASSVCLLRAARRLASMAAVKLRSAMVKQREDLDPLNAMTERRSLKETLALVAREQRPPEPSTGTISGREKRSSQSR